MTEQERKDLLAAEEVLAKVIIYFDQNRKRIESLGQIDTQAQMAVAEARAILGRGQG